MTSQYGGVTGTAGADQYWADFGSPAFWSGATTAEKEEGLREGSRTLDAMFHGRWKGVKAVATQDLDWPRLSVVDADGYAVDSASVPQQILNSAFELAGRYLEGGKVPLRPVLAEPGTIASERKKAGPVEKDTSYVGGKSQSKDYPVVRGYVSGLIVAGSEVVRA